jgi:hypothetical protein
MSCVGGVNIDVQPDAVPEYATPHRIIFTDTELHSGFPLCESHFRLGEEEEE